MTWPTKRQRPRQIQRQWQIHLENTFKEQSLRLLTFETFDQSDEKTWPGQQKYNDEDKDKYKDNDSRKGGRHGESTFSVFTRPSARLGWATLYLFQRFDFTCFHIFWGSPCTMYISGIEIEKSLKIFSISSWILRYNDWISRSMRLIGKILVLVSKYETESRKFLFSSRNTRFNDANSRSRLESWNGHLAGHWHWFKKQCCGFYLLSLRACQLTPGLPFTCFGVSAKLKLEN